MSMIFHNKSMDTGPSLGTQFQTKISKCRGWVGFGHVKLNCAFKFF